MKGLGEGFTYESELNNTEGLTLASEGGKEDLIPQSFVTTDEMLEPVETSSDEAISIVEKPRLTTMEELEIMNYTRNANEINNLVSRYKMNQSLIPKGIGFQVATEINVYTHTEVIKEDINKLKRNLSYIVNYGKLGRSSRTNKLINIFCSSDNNSERHEPFIITDFITLENSYFIGVENISKAHILRLITMYLLEVKESKFYVDIENYEDSVSRTNFITNGVVDEVYTLVKFLMDRN